MKCPNCGRECVDVTVMGDRYKRHLCSWCNWTNEEKKD